MIIKRNLISFVFTWSKALNAKYVCKNLIKYCFTLYRISSVWQICKSTLTKEMQRKFFNIHLLNKNTIFHITKILLEQKKILSIKMFESQVIEWREKKNLKQIWIQQNKLLISKINNIETLKAEFWFKS